MPRGVNKAILIGNLGSDPELKYTSQDKPYCHFNVATSESWRDGEGEMQTETTWHRVIVFGPQAEACNEYLNKGSKVYVEGKIQVREWKDNDGNKRTTTSIRAREVNFLGTRGEGGDGGGGRSGGGRDGGANRGGGGRDGGGRDGGGRDGGGRDGGGRDGGGRDGGGRDGGGQDGNDDGDIPF